MKKTLYLLAILAFLLPSMTFASFDVSLKFGSKGDAVSELQDFLTDQNVYTGKVDGKFGFGTLKAVKAFQEANNLSIDGYFGKASRTVAQTLLAVDLKASDDAEQAETGSVSPAVVTMPGCAGTTGFSATTGKPCDGSTPAPVTDVNTQSAISALTQQVQTLTQATQQIANNTTPVVQSPHMESITLKFSSSPIEGLNGSRGKDKNITCDSCIWVGTSIPTIVSINVDGKIVTSNGFTRDHYFTEYIDTKITNNDVYPDAEHLDYAANDISITPLNLDKSISHKWSLSSAEDSTGNSIDGGSAYGSGIAPTLIIPSRS